jgi:Fe-S cluster assembly ATP-binding protein
MSLIVKHLSVFIKEKQILEDINLEIVPRKVSVLMGPNGSGKTTLAEIIMGRPDNKWKIENFKLKIGTKDISNFEPDKRAKEGIFLAFQNPVAIPGVSVANMLWVAYKTVKKKRKSLSEFNEMLIKQAQRLAIRQDLLRRSLNEEFSGGEKKKLEMLQALVLEPRYAIFDEIDAGLDIDAVKIISKEILGLKKRGTGILLITHYQRILRHVKPDKVYILVNGKMAASGDYKLAEMVEESGYKRWIKKFSI